MKVEIKCKANVCGGSKTPEASEDCINCEDLIMEPLKDSEAPLSVLLNEVLSALPDNYYVCEKKLWCGNIGVDIDHIDNNLDKPLNYKKAAHKMLKLLKKESR